MIRLSRLTDYAIALLSRMGQEAPALLWTAPQLAEKTGLPMPTVAKVLKLLAKKNLIDAQRGALGGYRLGRAPLAISIAEIIEAMDGPIAITDCAENSTHSSCTIEKICPMSDGWNKVNHAVRHALAKISLAEMNSPKIRESSPLSVTSK